MPIKGARTVTRKELIETHDERVQDTFKLDPVVPITLKGKSYTIELNNFAVKEVMKATGFNVMAASFSPKEMENPDVMGALLYWGLKTHHEELTQVEVDKLFTFKHYPYVLNRLQAALEMFLPDLSDLTVEEEKKDETPRPPLPPSPGG